MVHLLALSLGPVQELIVAARRTRDLWFGSWMLSELARAAGQSIVATCGAENLIFPAAGRLGDLDATFANKIFARTPGDPVPVAKAVEQAVKDRLAELRDKTFERLYGDAGFHRKEAEAQVDHLIEIQWTSAAEGADGYAAARDRAEELLAARKNTRLWREVSWGAEVAKSSIDGLRESVIEDSLFGVLPAPELYRRFRVGEGERLCGVGLLKRWGRRTVQKRERRRLAADDTQDHHFLSTGHLAAGPVLERLERLAERPEAVEEAARLTASWKAFEATLSPEILKEQRVFVPGHDSAVLGPYDASLLFENRLPALFPEIETPRGRRERAKDPATALRAFLKEVGVPTPCPYYAILRADGDRMGKAIDAQRDAPAHQALSVALSEFSAKARQIVEETHRGELVYAGGDDVLAFVPLHLAVRCARALALDFAERLHDFPAANDSPAAKADRPTLSVGLAVVHFQESLRGALDLAHQAEVEAKRARDRVEPSLRAAGKDLEGGIAWFVSKRSGPPLRISGPGAEVAGQLEELARFHRDDRISDKAAYELRSLARLLDGTDAPLPSDPEEARLESRRRADLTEVVRLEAARILRRKQPKQGEAEEIEARDRKRLHDLIRACPSLEEFADRLIAARLLAEAQLQAWGPTFDPDDLEEPRA